MTPQVIAGQVQQMFGSIAPRYDATNTVLSFGIHHLWKRMLVNLLPEAGESLVLDICTGTGDLLPLLKRRFGRVAGVDFCLPMLRVGRSRAGHQALPVLQADAASLPFEREQLDALTVAFGVRNLENLDGGLKEMARVLRPGGYLAVLEFGQPDGFFGSLYRFYSSYFMPHIGGLLTGNKAAYEYLPETAAAFPCGDLFESRLEAAGFEPIRTRRLTMGIAYLYLARKY